MTSQKLIFLIGCLFFIVGDIFAQFDACQFQEDYRKQLNIDSQRTLDQEYKYIYEVDQSHRNGKQNEIIDLKNLLKIAVLIEDHGFPANTLDHTIANSIGVVFSHNTFKQYFFRSILDGYQKGEIPDDSMNFLLIKTFTDCLDYMFCETVDVNLKDENNLMIGHLDYLNHLDFKISNLCKTVNDYFENGLTKGLSVVHEWQDGTFTFQLLSNHKNDFFMHGAYWESTPSIYPLKKVNENSFVYTNAYNRIQYTFDQNRVAISNRYCDSEDRKYYFNLKRGNE